MRLAPAESRLRQREPRARDDAFLAFVRRQPCCVCFGRPAEAAHVRGACAARGKRETGKGEKPSDRWCVPLCGECHRTGPGALHRVGEAKFFAHCRIDPFEFADELRQEFAAERRGT